MSLAFENLLSELTYEKLAGDRSIQIHSIRYDSREMKPGDAFVAISGYKQDGHDFIQSAIAKGASVIIAEKDGDFSPGLKVIVKDSRLALAQLAGEFYQHPSRLLKTIGVTGTNGKTTVSYWLKSILQSAGMSTGLIGTVKYFIGDRSFSAARTTPESLDLQALLSRMVEEKIQSVVMEVSSHALTLKRVQGIQFDIAVFTNLTHEHLDFHKRLDTYRDAKGILFENLSPMSFAILNQDDPVSSHYAKKTSAQKCFYSIKGNTAEFSVNRAEFKPSGTRAVFQTPQGEQEYHLQPPGDFNLSNFAAVLAAAQKLGLNYEQIKTGAEGFAGAPGRMEKIDLGQKFNLWIDYAHTPDGMERVLATVKSFTSGRLICLFGCGGDRDKEKRPQMGSIAERYCDLAIVSSDNPRNEEPLKIAEEVLSGINDKRKIKVILDRKEALEEALKLCQPKDTLIVTGKGHENYQEVKGKKYSFHEREILESGLAKMGYSKK